MTKNLTIRPYRAETDRAALSAIWLDASRGAHAFLGEARLLEQQTLIETRYLPLAETWVAEIAGQPAGFISLLGSFIGGLFVMPAWQGRGVGRRLVAHALALKGTLELDVYLQNDGAVAAYRAMGFREVSRTDTDAEGLPFPTARLRLES